jgi:hypothetical protein
LQVADGKLRIADFGGDCNLQSEIRHLKLKNPRSRGTAGDLRAIAKASGRA